MTRRSAIKAEPPADPQPQDDGLSVGYLMGRARASLLTGLDTRLERFGLSGMQFAVLKHLSEGRASTAAALCRYMQYDTGAMTRILDRLEEKGLVRRERSREDRRTVVLRLAPQGRTQLPRLAVVGVRVLHEHLAGFTAEEVAALKGYLGRMIQNGQAEADNQATGTGGRT